MTTGNKIRVILLSALLAAALFAGGGMVCLNRYLNSSGFREIIRTEAREKAGIDLALEAISVDLFRGVKAKNVVLAAPAADEPPTAEAQEIEFSYRLGDLLRKKLVVDEIHVLRPRLRLGGNYPFAIPLPPPPEGGAKMGGKHKRAGGGEKERGGWTAAVSALTVSDGAVELATGTGFDPFEAEGVDATIRFPSPGAAEARMTVASAGWQNRVVVRKGRAEAKLSGLDPDARSGRAEVSASALLVDPFAPDQEDKADLSFRVEAREGEARIEDFRARFPGTEVSGRFAAVRGDRAIRAEGKAAFDCSDVGEIIRRFLPVKNPPVRGPARGDFTVSGVAVAGPIVIPDFRGTIESSALAFPSLGIVQDIVIPLRAEKGRLIAEKAEGSMAGGTLGLDAEADLSAWGRSPYRASWRAERIDLDRLFRESPRSHDPSWKRFRCAGTLQARGDLSGDAAGLLALIGKAVVVVTGGSVSGYPLPAALARLSEGWMEPFDFERAEAKLSCRGGTVTLEDVTVLSGGMKIVARGTVDLNRRGELDLRVGLLYTPELAEAQPKAFRLALRPMPGEKNLLGIEFRVYGSPERPETDLLEVMARRSIGGFLGGR